MASIQPPSVEGTPCINAILFCLLFLVFVLLALVVMLALSEWLVAGGYAPFMRALAVLFAVGAFVIHVFNSWDGK